MVSSLPNETILDILELAATASPAAALTLCLLSSTTARSIRPILYRKVRLVLLHDTQVPSPVVLRPDPAAHRALQLLTRARSGSCTPAGAPRSTRPWSRSRRRACEPGGAGVRGRLAVGPAVPEPRPEKPRRTGWIPTSQVSSLIRRGCAIGHPNHFYAYNRDSSAPRRTIQRRHEGIPI